MSRIVAEYGITADNLTAACFGDRAFVMIPKPNGADYLVASAWRLTGGFADWNRGRFYSHDVEVADEAAFRAHVEGELLHHRETTALNRERHRRPCSTPWGTAEDTVV